MRVRIFERGDLPGVIVLWNESVASGEVVYYPLTEAYFDRKFIADPNYDPRYALVAEEGGGVIGFIHGVCKKITLPGETNENTPGFITCFFVKKEARGQGVGRALIEALSEAFRSAGKRKIACSGGNPINLDWRVPGTPNHDHNNAPGMDADCMGHGFLLRLGFSSRAEEVAMYMAMADYRLSPEVAELQAKLESEGVYFGRYDPLWNYEHDEIFDRVGSEYWRTVLNTELACWREGKPCTDIRFIPNGKIPAGPRPILCAAHNGHIVGFTGPVDLQTSGRGWFSGICVDPAYGQRGIGSVLFNVLMREFVWEGAAFTTLFTGASGHAQRIYRRAGLRPVRRFTVLDKAL